jgi:hypothetical protein
VQIVFPWSDRRRAGCYTSDRDHRAAWPVVGTMFLIAAIRQPSDVRTATIVVHMRLSPAADAIS